MVHAAAARHGLAASDLQSWRVERLHVVLVVSSVLAIRVEICSLPDAVIRASFPLPSRGQNVGEAPDSA